MRDRPALALALARTLAIALAFAGAARAAAAEGQRDAALEAAVLHLANTAPGVAGVSAVHLESGRWIGVHANAGFPMQSTFKLPVALVVLDAVDRGKVGLADRVHLFRWDMQPDGSALTDAHPSGGVDVSVHDLLAGMLATSDNTACDALLGLVGGPAAVTRWLRANGITDMRVDRNERRLGDDWYGVDKPLPGSRCSAAALRAQRAAVPAARRTRADDAFASDPRDHASPAAFTALLALVQRGGALSPASTDTLLAMLSRCATGAHRIPGMLPPRCRVAHKTGTAGTWRGHTHAVNDVGLIRLPGGGGHVAIAVLVRDVHGDTAAAERTIARIARAVFDAWNAPD